MKMKRRMLFAVAAMCVASVFAAEGAFPRVWTSVSGCRTAEEFEQMAADCVAHGVQVVESRNGDTDFLAAQLAICRKYGLKMFFGIPDPSKTDNDAKKSGLYELAVMSGGCYRGLAIDRNLFAFTPGRHEIIVEPPVYSRDQAYAKHPHYYMLGDGHYFGGYVPTGEAEVIVPERLFDGRQHLRILPAKVEWAPPDAKPENDSVAHLADAKEIKERRLVKLSFDLTGLEGCRLDKVGLAVYWAMDDKSPDWKPDRTCYSVFSRHTRQRMRWRVRAALDRWRKANGGTFPADVVIAVRLGDEIFNATSFLNGPAVSFPLWDYSASARDAFAKATPEGVTYPRTWGASEVYGPDACAQFLYLFHKACADYLKVAVDDFHAAVPTLQTFRNTTRGGVWSYGNDHDGTGQELLAEVLDFLHLDPYPVHEGGYNGGCIPFDMAYMSGLARRYNKKLVPWLQAHRFPSGKLVHPTPDDLRRIYEQHTRFAPDAIMWLGYNPRGDSCTFPNGDKASWEAAKAIHADFAKRPEPVRKRPDMAVVRPYSARALVCEGGDGTRHPEDAILCEFVRIWSRELSREYDIFEVPPFESDAARAKRTAELAKYRHVISSVDWPGATNVAAGCADKVFTKKDFAKKREELRQLANSLVSQVEKGRK